MASVCSAVLKRATCPVVVVHPTAVMAENGQEEMAPGVA